MISGIGTDLVHIPRMQRLLDKYGVKAAERILSEQELKHFQRAVKPAAFLAKRFAAKEAAVKALGTGFRAGISLQNITVSNDKLGKPQLALNGEAKRLSQQKQIEHVLLSLSDDGDYASAYVIMTQ